MMLLAYGACGSLSVMGFCLVGFIRYDCEAGDSFLSLFFLRCYIFGSEIHCFSLINGGSYYFTFQNAIIDHNHHGNPAINLIQKPNAWQSLY